VSTPRGHKTAVPMEMRSWARACRLVAVPVTFVSVVNTLQPSQSTNMIYRKPPLLAQSGFQSNACSPGCYHNRRVRLRRGRPAALFGRESLCHVQFVGDKCELHHFNLDRDDNLYWYIGGTPNFITTNGMNPTPISHTISGWQALGEDPGSVVENPQFTDSAYPAYHFTLAAGSPAFGIGFVPFDSRLAGTLPGSVAGAPVVAPASSLQLLNPASGFQSCRQTACALGRRAQSIC
jgi:hypothetical protein